MNYCYTTCRLLVTGVLPMVFLVFFNTKIFMVSMKYLQLSHGQRSFKDTNP
jgi:hypothetical protein